MKEWENNRKGPGWIYAPGRRLFSLVSLTPLILLLAGGCADQDQGVQANSNGSAARHSSDSKGAGESGAADTGPSDAGPSLTITVQKDDSNSDQSKSATSSTSLAHTFARKHRHRAKKTADAPKTTSETGRSVSGEPTNATPSNALPPGDARPSTSGGQTTGEIPLGRNPRLADLATEAGREAAVPHPRGMETELVKWTIRRLGLPR